LDSSENLISIKTHPGGAQAVASAIDQAGWKEIIGTVGGDDTILVIVKPKQAAADVLKRFKELNLKKG
jgi:transcriptional regulator of arginine metabolism